MQLKGGGGGGDCLLAPEQAPGMHSHSPRHLRALPLPALHLSRTDCMQLKAGGGSGGGDCLLAQEWAPGKHSHTSIDTSAHCRSLLCTSRALIACS